MTTGNAGLAALPIESFIPHRGTMRWVDRLLECDDVSAVVEADLPWCGVQVRHGMIGSWLGIEYMAQAVAAWSGWRAWTAGRAPRIGMLLGSRCYAAACSAFPAGAVLRIDVHNELEGEGKGEGEGAHEWGLFRCSLTLAGEVVATAMLSVIELATIPLDVTGDGVPHDLALQACHAPRAHAAAAEAACLSMDRRLPVPMS